MILAEDAQSQSFAHQALRATGANPRRIRHAPLPSNAGGGGGGHGFVLARYATEVTAFRRQNAKAKTGLIVHIDGDDRSVGERHQQLAAKLADADAPARGRDEAIAELAPKRNIEAWIYALDATVEASLTTIDERTEYPKLKYPGECARASQTFAEHARERSTPAAARDVPSLLDGIAEFQRLP